jgi:hypothetical protein
MVGPMCTRDCFTVTYEDDELDGADDYIEILEVKKIYNTIKEN